MSCEAFCGAVDALVMLYVSKLDLPRHWGTLSSKDWVVELSVPGDEKAESNVFLVLNTYDSMQRIARMVLGREMSNSMLQVTNSQ